MKLPGPVRQVGKRIIQATPILRRHVLASTDYRLLSGPEEARAMAGWTSGWFGARTVARQERAYARLLAAMHRGEPRIDFQVAIETVAATGIANPSLLEVGCGSGYYCEVFATLLPGRVRYTGVDYSKAMITRARAHYPSAAFEFGDATRLPYGDNTFDIVFNGVSLLHIVDYQAAVHQAARVASRYCVLHTVPVHQHQTMFLSKYAYGGPVAEIIFNKKELISLCVSAGLRLEHEWPCIPYDVHDVTGHHSTTETYLFSKQAR
ncbi:class I SAM-dependent methyltransferase [Bradyrhizobium japonicum]|uniref:class I SAM-dependent methyltransferase n=1 Tax=Bradyrhizobium japonicum TaxID=375 RepID=UPI0009B8861E|nr:class I SAM-dependent methyltransferase [Bradyrhizobium japonicum]